MILSDGDIFSLPSGLINHSNKIVNQEEIKTFKDVVKSNKDLKLDKEKVMNKSRSV